MGCRLAMQYMQEQRLSVKKCISRICKEYTRRQASQPGTKKDAGQRPTPASDSGRGCLRERLGLRNCSKTDSSGHDDR
jgi:hypothetical protein